MDGERKIAVVRAVAFVVLLAILAFAAWRLGWADYLLGEGGIRRLEALVARNLPAAIAIYALSVVVGGTALALPGFLFPIAAGVLFGPWLGTVCCVLAATLSAVISFLAGRTFLKDVVKPLALRNRHLKRWLFDEADRDAVLMLLITRTIPVIPYNLQNFAYGTTDIKLSTYTWCTLVFMVPGTALYTFAAAGVVDESNRALYLALAAVLVVLVGLSVVLVHRRAQAVGKERSGR